MLQAVGYHNSDGPNSNRSCFDLSQDEDDFNNEQNWENGLIYYFHYTSHFL